MKSVGGHRHFAVFHCFVVPVGLALLDSGAEFGTGAFFYAFIRYFFGLGASYLLAKLISACSKRVLRDGAKPGALYCSLASNYVCLLAMRFLPGFGSDPLASGLLLTISMVVLPAVSLIVYILCLLYFFFSRLLNKGNREGRKE